MKIIIIGAGEVGYHVASQLCAENKNVIVIDKNETAIHRVSDQLDVQTIQGSGSSPAVLEEAGITEADILLAVTDSDETNLVACLISDLVSPKTKKLARIREGAWDRYYDQFRIDPPHIDSIINPEIEVVNSIERLLFLPGVVDVAEFEAGQLKIVGIVLEENSQLCDVRLADLSQTLYTIPPLIVAIVRGEELIIPTGEDRLQPNDLIYFMSKDSLLTENLKLFDIKEEVIKRVLIVGGGRIGYRLAKQLEDQPVHTKIIELNKDRSSFLADKLSKAVVLCADGSDQNFLASENIQDMDALVTVTDDEETNILVSLLGKRRGVKKAITKVDRLSYYHLMSTIGIHRIVSPRLSAINSILQHIRRGWILSDITLKGDQAEAIEAVALASSNIVGSPLKSIAFPKEALLAAIIQDQEIIIPTGESIVRPGDRIVVFAKRTAIPKIEEFLSVTLEMD